MCIISEVSGLWIYAAWLKGCDMMVCYLTGKCFQSVRKRSKFATSHVLNKDSPGNGIWLKIPVLESGSSHSQGWQANRRQSSDILVHWKPGCQLKCRFCGLLVAARTVGFSPPRIERHCGTLFCSKTGEDELCRDQLYRAGVRCPVVETSEVASCACMSSQRASLTWNKTVYRSIGSADCKA